MMILQNPFAFFFFLTKLLLLLFWLQETDARGWEVVQWLTGSANLKRKAVFQPSSFRGYVTC